ncbi:hypothetical protein CDD83_3350 [Cordyceps sp. RAO-2017]|nr:hypothetical protein CDD83_3350 [Cordyceps sp. RAO-2017]
MSSNFISAVRGQHVSAAPVQSFLDDNSFPDFTSSSLALFSLGPDVGRQVLAEVATELNKQACAELGFEPDEFEELGLAAQIHPDSWSLGDQSPERAVQWFIERFPKNETIYNDLPKWYPIGFIGVAEANWREAGVVLVQYDAKEGEMTVRAILLDPSNAGAALISLRQGDDDFNNIKKFHEKS